MPSSRTIPLLVGGMLVTGISNSILNKYQDMQCVDHCSPHEDPSKRVNFEQPVWQTLQMFVGETLCFLPVLWAILSRRYRNRKENGHNYQVLSQHSAEERVQHNHNESSDTTTATTGRIPLPVLFFIPALCDIIGTTLMNCGLIFTPVSIYQMTRGALVLWVGIFSVLFLKRHLFLYQWLMLVTVMLGVSIVGLSGTILKDIDQSSANANANATAEEGSSLPVSEAVSALLGVILILFAQIFTAAQFVIEEKIMSRYEVDPLLAVGYEGVWGLSTVLLSMPILHYAIGSKPSGRGGYFDMYTGYNQITSSKNLIWSSIAIALSISLFNSCGLAVTRAISATARSTIDTTRTLGIWIVSLLLGWEVFKPFSGVLQSIGFGLLVYGTLVFNGIFNPPQFIAPSSRIQLEEEQDGPQGEADHARSQPALVDVTVRNDGD